MILATFGIRRGRVGTASKLKRITFYRGEITGNVIGHWSLQSQLGCGSGLIKKISVIEHY